MPMSQGQDRRGGWWSRGLLCKSEAKGSLDNCTHEAPVACGNASEQCFLCDGVQFV